VGTVHDDKNISLSDNPDKLIVEQYFVSKEAYAVYGEGPNNDFTLYMAYDFQPWDGEDFNSTNNRSILIDHVNRFRFMQAADGTTIRLKLCVWAPFAASDNSDYNASICKEKVVF
jgi:hypothetical protein